MGVAILVKGSGTSPKQSLTELPIVFAPVKELILSSNEVSEKQLLPPGPTYALRVIKSLSSNDALPNVSVESALGLKLGSGISFL